MLELSHITCPLIKPEGDSRSSSKCDSFPPPLDSADESSPRHQPLLAPPPEHFADVSSSGIANKPREGPKLVYLKRGTEGALSNSNTTSDSYDYDDYFPPPACDTSIHSDSVSWPHPPSITEEPSL